MFGMKTNGELGLSEDQVFWRQRVVKDVVVGRNHHVRQTRSCIFLHGEDVPILHQIVVGRQFVVVGSVDQSIELCHIGRLLVSC